MEEYKKYITLKKVKKYYCLLPILLTNSTYNMIFGERSNGKTFSVSAFSFEDWFINGNELAIIRRWDTDFKGKNGTVMFDNLETSGIIKKVTKGKWETIKYSASKWYAAKWDDSLKKYILSERPFAYGFALNTGEHDKSTSYPKVKNILFDEFISRKGYINNEWIEYTNILSTIIRDRDDVRIFMCGNTVNQYCPYFDEMGLTNIRKMKQGSIDIYTYADTELKVAVEYCSPTEGGKKSDKYFAFDNPKLNMIKNGAWEIAIYPHLPFKYKTTDIKFMYFIEFNRDLLQCEIINVNNIWFTYVHRKTTPIKDEKNDLIFSSEYKPEYNHRRRISKPFDNLGKKIYWYYLADKVFYQDNTVGEVMRNYLMWSDRDRGIL